MKDFVFFDLETTGIGPEDRLVQVAFRSKTHEFNELFKPPLPISIEAQAVCHITPKMVATKPAFKESDDYALVKEVMEDPDLIHVAHNAIFDVGYFAREGIALSNVICTYRLTHHFDTVGALPKQNLQYLRYHYELEVEGTPHDAWGDVLVLEALFNHYQKTQEISVEEMIKISATPIMMKKWPFGKYKEQPFGIAPPDYLQWVKDNVAMGEDLAYTVEHWLNYYLKR